MKLKYYMRGLGIGIILTTLILTINNPKEKLTDDEIKARAEGLGMVMKEEDNGALDKVLAGIKPTTSPTPTGTAAPAGTVTPEVTPIPEETETPEATAAPTQAPEDGNVNIEVTSGLDDKVTLTVKEGMSAREVSILLETYGIVEDATDFNEYVVELGKAEVVRVGTYTLTKGADYDEIVNTLTKN